MRGAMSGAQKTGKALETELAKLRIAIDRRLEKRVNTAGVEIKTKAKRGFFKSSLRWLSALTTFWRK